jgi:hypothetical protein
MTSIILKPITVLDEVGKTLSASYGLQPWTAPLISLTIAFAGFLVLVLIYKEFISSKDNFDPLIRPKGELPYTREFAEMPLQTAADLSLYKNGKCLCNSIGACDYCLDVSMEERTDHINHMMNRRPKALYRSVSQLRNNVMTDIDKNNLDYKLNNNDK